MTWRYVTAGVSAEMVRARLKKSLLRVSKLSNERQRNSNLLEVLKLVGTIQWIFKEKKNKGKKRESEGRKKRGKQEQN